MKQKLLFLVLAVFFSVNGFSQAVANQPSDIIQCNWEVFNLTQQTPEILGDQDPQFFTVTYFASAADAEDNVNPITNPQQFVSDSQQQTIFARVDNLEDDSYDITQFNIQWLNWDIPITQPEIMQVCDDDDDGMAPVDLTSVIDQMLNGAQGLEVTFHEAPSDAEAGTFAIPNPENYISSIPYAYGIFARITDVSTGCFIIMGIEVLIIECTDNIISGTLTYNMEDNDCTSGTSPGAFIMLSLTQDNNVLYTYTDAEGNYTFYNVPDGNSHLTVIGQGPLTFQTSPASYTVIAPGESTGYNFCLVAPAPVNDAGITIVPYGNPRPGFPMTYALMLYNAGNITLNGNATFGFDSTMMTYNSSSPAMTLAGNVLSIPYTNLLPGQIQYVYVNFTVMTPPTVNEGDIMAVVANITPLENDIDVINNQDIYAQVVVNSWDPNDITCREGEFITEEQADGYLHYVIRFQNTGSADAINIRVEDILDEKLDPATFQPIGASHDYRIEMLNNEVKFIFENINLSGEDNEPESHGFVVYRIKPRPNVQLGDTFEATASIFFDFNEPIITNTATTTIQNAAGVKDVTENGFVLYPNPASDKVNIRFADNFAGKMDITITDVLGKTMMNNTIELQNSAAGLDISSLNSGIYFITVQSEGKSVTKKLVIK